MTTVEFVKRAVIVLALVLAPVAMWWLFDVVLIGVGAILIAVLLHILAEPFTRWCKLPQSVALVLSGIIIMGVLGGLAYLFGSRIGAQLQDVLARSDTGINSIADKLRAHEIGRLILSHLKGGSFSVSSVVGEIFTVSASFIGGVLITFIAGFYFAAQPTLYRSGLDKLFPQQWRAPANEAIDDVANALRLWLLGQLMQTFLIGAMSTLAVWMIGLPSPLALGIIAGGAELVPYLGPIIAAIPAILVAATTGLHAVLWTAAAYLLIYQIEGNLVVPIIQRHMVFIPPAVLLLAVVAISIAFGTAAIIFAAPIAVILFVLIKRLYIRDALGEPTSIPGESS